MPLTAETRDRQIEVRFAVPANSSRRYALRVYVASSAGVLPESPTLTLPWSAIEAAYESEADVFTDITATSPKARDVYVIRKIKRVMVPGIRELRDQRAFALEAIFGGYHTYRVSLVEEAVDGREMARVDGQAVYDAPWASILDNLSYAGQRVVAGSSAAGRQTGEELFWLGWSGVLARATMPVKRILGLAKDEVGKAIVATLPFQFVRGLVGGVVDGAVGDYNLIRHPINSATEFFYAMRELFNVAIKIATEFELENFVSRLFREMRPFGVEWPTPLAAWSHYERFQGRVAYVYGYLVGMIVWQIASFLALEAVGVGIAGVAEKVAAVIKGTAIGARLAVWVARSLVLFARIVDYMADLADIPIARLLAIWRATTSVAEKAGAVVAAKYPRFAREILEPALKAMATAEDVGGKAIDAFSRVAAFPEDVGREAAQRLMAYMVRKIEQGASPRYLTWLDTYKKRNVTQAGVPSSRAIKEAVDAAPDIPDGISDEVMEALVASADEINRADGIGADNLVATFVQKHRNPGRPGPPDPPIATERFMQAVLEGPEGRVSQRTVQEVIRIHSDLDAAAWTEEALTGAARFIEQNGDDGAALLERFVREVTPDSAERVDVVLSKLKGFTDPDGVNAFVRLVRDGEARRMAAIVDNLTYDGIQETLVRAIDRLRKPENGPLVPGVATKPQGPPGSSTSSLLGTMVNATNKGTAYEPVATLRLVERGEFTVDDIVEMGRRFETNRPDGSLSTVEADAFVLRDKRVSIDFKHASSVDDLISTDLLERIEQALQRATPQIDEWWFAVQGNVTVDKLAEIQAVNARLRQALPERFPTDPIRVIEQLGDF